MLSVTLWPFLTEEKQTKQAPTATVLNRYKNIKQFFFKIKKKTYSTSFVIFERKFPIRFAIKYPINCNKVSFK